MDLLVGTGDLTTYIRATGATALTLALDGGRTPLRLVPGWPVMP